MACDKFSFNHKTYIYMLHVSAELTWLPKTSSLFVLFCCYFCLWLQNLVISTNLVVHFNQGTQYFITGALLARIFGRRWMPWIAHSWSGISTVWPVYYSLKTWPSPWMYLNPGPKPYRRCRAGRRVKERWSFKEYKIEAVISCRHVHGTTDLHKGSNLNNLRHLKLIPNT